MHFGHAETPLSRGTCLGVPRRLAVVVALIGRPGERGSPLRWGTCVNRRRVPLFRVSSAKGAADTGTQRPFAARWQPNGAVFNPASDHNEEPGLHAQTETPLQGTLLARQGRRLGVRPRGDGRACQRARADAPPASEARRPDDRGRGLHHHLLRRRELHCRRRRPGRHAARGLRGRRGDAVARRGDGRRRGPAPPRTRCRTRRRRPAEAPTAEPVPETVADPAAEAAPAAEDDAAAPTIDRRTGGRAPRRDAGGRDRRGSGRRGRAVRSRGGAGRRPLPLARPRSSVHRSRSRRPTRLRRRPSSATGLPHVRRRRPPASRRSTTATASASRPSG